MRCPVKSAQAVSGQEERLARRDLVLLRLEAGRRHGTRRPRWQGTAAGPVPAQARLERSEALASGPAIGPAGPVSS